MIPIIKFQLKIHKERLAEKPLKIDRTPLHPIMLISYFRGSRFVYSTGEKIHASDWDPAGMQPVFEKRRKDLDSVRLQLNRYRQEFTRIWNHHENLGEILTPGILRREMDKVFKQISENRLEFLNFFEQTMQCMTSGKIITPAGRPYAKWSVKNYKKTYNNLIKYYNKKKDPLTWATIDMHFYNNFIAWCNEKDHSINHIGSMIKCIKVILRMGFEEGLHESIIWQNRKFKTIFEDVDTVYLNELELQAIADLDLKENPVLDRHRDRFLIGCYTGQRYSDFSRISKSNIRETMQGKIVVLNSEKTGKETAIPLHPVAEQIFIKYNWDLPSAISNQKMNDAIHTICAEAKINAEVEISEIRGGLKVYKKAAKHELVTSHTARRSFATNAFLAGIPSISIMKLTGHTTERSFLRYIRISSQENAIKLLSHSFFAAK
jgi:site-specific recombinase XerD